MRVTRRDFCAQMAAAAPLSTLPLATQGPRTQSMDEGGPTTLQQAQGRPEPVEGRAESRDAQKLPPRLIVSCNLYSFNHALTSGAMTLPEVMEHCASIGFDAVDPTGYYFAGYPTAPGDEAIYRIKHRAFRLGLDISGTGIRTDFAAPREEDRAADLTLTERWVEVAAKLGAPMLRVFAGHGAPGTTWTDARERVMAALETAAAVGARHGVAIVLQNHQDVLRTADEVLEIRRRIPSEWFGLNVDIGSLRTGDTYEEIARLAPFAYTWQIKELVYRRGREEKTNLQAIVRILRESSYRGFVPLETLGEGDARQKVRRLLDEFREAL